MDALTVLGSIVAAFLILNSDEPAGVPTASATTAPSREFQPPPPDDAPLELAAPDDGEDVSLETVAADLEGPPAPVEVVDSAETEDEDAAAEAVDPEQQTVLDMLAFLKRQCCGFRCEHPSDRSWKHSIDMGTVYRAALLFDHAITFFPSGRYKTVSDGMVADIEDALDEVKRTGKRTVFFTFGSSSGATGRPTVNKKLGRWRMETIYRLVLRLAEEKDVLNLIEVYGTNIGYQNLTGDVCSLFDAEDPRTMDDYNACSVVRQPHHAQQTGFALVVPGHLVPEGGCE